MIKKILSIILCAALALAFASCAKNSDNKDENVEPLVFDAFDSAYSSYDSSAVAAYSDLCKAVYNGETNVGFNLGMFDNVIQLFYTSYPLNVLVKNIEKNKDSSGVTITYKESAETAKDKSKAFSDKVNAILAECKSGNKRAFTIKVYNYVTSNVKQSDKEGLTVYDAIMAGEGDSYTASNMFEYLLRQGGVSSSHILASDARGAGWGLSTAELDGDNYLFDPMTEIIANGGSQLCYFGMTTEDANAEGLKEFIYTNRSSATQCDNPYFDACRNCKSWELGENGGSLLVTRNDGEIVEIAL